MAIDTVDIGGSMNDAAMGDPMDDLFGDATDELDLGDVTASLPTVSLAPPPGLMRRLAEMQASGCCSKLTWSNTGSIARITEDGSKLTFRMLSRDLNLKSWRLSEESKHTIKAPKDCYFTHLQFNHVGHDLALVDNLGRVHLYVMTNIMSGGNAKTHVDAVCGSEKPHDLDAIVGLHWLPQHPLDCRAMYIGPVSRSITGWTSQSRNRDINAVKVHHPADNARALLYITRNGKLTLLYQHQDSWKSTNSSLETFTSSGTVLTHADLCEHNGALLLVAFDTARRLQLFSVDLMWNAAYAPSDLKQPQQVTAVAPELNVTSILTILDPVPQHMDHAKLVQLSLIPATAEVADQSMSTSTTILATFVRAFIPVHGASQFQDSSTLMLRWQVESEIPSLHEGFRYLKPSAQYTSSAQPKIVLQAQPNVVSSKIILSVRPKCFDTILACVTSDGIVEFRDRATFELLESYMDTDHVNSLPQSGFSYVAEEHHIDAAISFDGSAMIVTTIDDKLKPLTMTFQYGWQRIDDTSGSSSLAEAAIVCLARQYMSMVCSNVAPDEVLALLPHSLAPDLQQLLIREVFRLSRQSPDISALDERTRHKTVFSESLLPRAYGLQLYLGISPGREGRSLTGQYAWALLNLRHVCVSISQSAMMRLDPERETTYIIVDSLHGQVKWVVDLITYILAALLSVKDIAVRDLSKPARGVFESYMHDTNNPAFLLLLCSYPRTLLRLLSQVLPRLSKLAQELRDRGRTVAERQHLTAISELGKDLPFTFEGLKTFLDHTETAMNTGPNPLSLLKHGQSTPSADLVMTISGRLPEELEQPLRALLISAIPTLLQDADWSKLYFANCSWLGLDGRRSMEQAKAYDVLKKTLLPPNASLRHCRRCGSVMEDINLDKPKDHPPWLMMGQRYCVCMCLWYVP